MFILHGWLAKKESRPEAGTARTITANCPRCGERFPLRRGTVAVYGARRAVVTCPRCRHWEAVADA